MIAIVMSLINATTTGRDTIGRILTQTCTDFRYSVENVYRMKYAHLAQWLRKNFSPQRHF